MTTHIASQTPEELLQAFSATDYRVRIAGAVHVLRPGRVNASLDAALEKRDRAVMTAFNPQARRVDDASNRRRQQQLLEILAARGREFHPAVNHDPSGAWPDEKAVLIVDIGLQELDHLACHFDQAAVVTGQAGEAARLRLYGEGWPRTLPEWACKVK